MVIRYSVKELLAKNRVTRPIKYLVAYIYIFNYIYIYIYIYNHSYMKTMNIFNFEWDHLTGKIRLFESCKSQQDHFEQILSFFFIVPCSFDVYI